MKKRQIAIAAALVIVSTAGLTLTNEKMFEKVQARKVVSMIEGVPGVEVMELNPLKTGEHPEIVSLIETHFQELLKTQDFVEDYQNITVYTKRAKYIDTYVVFAKYEMKIKDIYSPVPGLETFYVKRDEEKSGYQIEREKLDDITKRIIQTVAAHDDTVALFEQTEKEYNDTLQSDALLHEALADLQNAYKGSGD